MLYRVSLTGKHDRFSVPQLGYLGYHLARHRSVSPGCVNPPVYERRNRKQVFGVLLAHAP